MYTKNILLGDHHRKFDSPDFGRVSSNLQPAGAPRQAMETVEPDLRCMVLGYSPARYSVSWTTTTSIPPTALTFGNKVLIF